MSTRTVRTTGPPISDDSLPDRGALDVMLARYELAQSFLQCRYPMSNPMVNNDAVLPRWIRGADSFWYQRRSASGREYRLVDCAAGTNEAAFDHGLLAGLLAGKVGGAVDRQDLPLRHMVVTLDPVEVRFAAFDRFWLFAVECGTLTEVEDYLHDNWSPYGNDPTFYPLNLYNLQPRHLVSPDGARAVFLKDHNLWLDDRAGGKAQLLTEDGAEGCHYGPGDLNYGDRAVPGRWSLDSRYILTVQNDLRAVARRKLMHYVPDDNSLEPKLVEEHLGGGLAGTKDTHTQRLIIIDVSSGEKKSLDHLSLLPLFLGYRAADLFRTGMTWWSWDSAAVYFVALSRGHKSARVMRWHVATGQVSMVFEETADTRVSLTADPLAGEPAIVPLPETGELVWYSERSGHGHLYLYDLASGQVKHAITAGDWVVRHILHVDTERRELVIQTAGREGRTNPYYRDICTVHMDTGVLTPLAAGNHDYHVPRYLDEWVLGETLKENFGYSIEEEAIHGVSPSGRYFVATRSRVDTAPETVLLDRVGHEVMVVERADVSGLPDTWVWPEPVMVKAADGETDIYAVVFRPPGYSPDESYPVVEYANSGRSQSAIPAGSFDLSVFCGNSYYNCMALAALGFIAVVIDGRGTPLRDRAFSHYRHGAFYHTSDFDDRIGGIRQLAVLDPAMDLDRVGFVTTENLTNGIYAALKHSDFYRVSVMHCFYDPRYGSVMHTEALDGMLDGKNSFYPEDCAAGLEGRLLLIQGMKSMLLPSAFRLVEALQQADKEFDMLCLPNLYNALSPYSMRRGWDYLVRPLLGLEPPRDFHLEDSKSKASKDPETQKAQAELMKKLLPPEKDTGPDGTALATDDTA